MLHAGRAAIDMKHIKQDFSLKAWVRDPGVDLEGWVEANIISSESGHVAYQIKADYVCSKMVANGLPKDTPSTQGVGSKGQTISFCDSSHIMLHIKLRGIERTAL